MTRRKNGCVVVMVMMGYRAAPFSGRTTAFEQPQSLAQTTGKISSFELNRGKMSKIVRLLLVEV
jgi:hypothetical protein